MIIFSRAGFHQSFSFFEPTLTAPTSANVSYIAISYGNIQYANQPQSSGERCSAADRTTQLVTTLFSSNFHPVLIPSGGLRRGPDETFRGDEGQLVEARTYGAWLSSENQTSPAIALLHAYRKLGRDAEGDEIAALIEKTLNKLRRRAADRGAPGDDFYLYGEAQFHAIDGRSDEALETLRRRKDSAPWVFTYIKRDPYFESLHGMLRFQQIVAEVEAELANIRMQYLASLGDEPA